MKNDSFACVWFNKAGGWLVLIDDGRVLGPFGNIRESENAGMKAIDVSEFGSTVLEGGESGSVYVVYRDEPEDQFVVDRGAA